MAQAVFALAPDAIGDVYPDLQATFVALLRDYSEARADAFLKALRRAKIVCVNKEMHTLLSVMIDTPAEVRDEFATRQHALDPSPTSKAPDGRTGFARGYLDARGRMGANAIIQPRPRAALIEQALREVRAVRSEPVLSRGDGFFGLELAWMASNWRVR
jgi:hypothetical protein